MSAKHEQRLCISCAGRVCWGVKVTEEEEGEIKTFCCEC